MKIVPTVTCRLHLEGLIGAGDSLSTVVEEKLDPGKKNIFLLSDASSKRSYSFLFHCRFVKFHLKILCPWLSETDRRLWSTVFCRSPCILTKLSDNNWRKAAPHNWLLWVAYRGPTGRGQGPKHFCWLVEWQYIEWWRKGRAVGSLICSHIQELSRIVARSVLSSRWTTQGSFPSLLSVYLGLCSSTETSSLFKNSFMIWM